jgi:hypothetical protein
MGWAGPLWPVVASHFEQVPLTAWRLWQTLQLLRERRAQ